MCSSVVDSVEDNIGMKYDVFVSIVMFLCRMFMF